MKLDVGEQVRLLVCAEEVLARAFDSLAVAEDRLTDDVAPQAWYAADTCRRHSNALAPFAATHARSSATRRPVDVPGLRAEDVLLLTSLVALAWDMAGTAAWAVHDRELQDLADSCSRQTHSQLEWLVRRLYRRAWSPVETESRAESEPDD